MPVTYTAAMLKGRTVRAFSMLGKPCVGAEYAGNGDAHRLEAGARCFICGRPAANAHHEPPKGMGGGAFRLDTPNGPRILRPPLLAVCGSGNACGCHAMLHKGIAKVRWEWDSELFEREWLEGRLDEELYENDERLFAMGRYMVEVGGGEKEVRPC